MAKVKKIVGIVAVCVFIAFLLALNFNEIKEDGSSLVEKPFEYQEIESAQPTAQIEVMETPTLIVEKVAIENDQDGDGILDLDDIVEGARKDAQNQPVYRSEYYSGGYPPDHEGVCTDVVWRAFKNAGYNLKDLVDKDIRANISQYPRVEGRPDPNIDFRRVPNLDVFFKKYALSLDLDIKPYDKESVKEWQGGDIVVFDNPQHIAVVSDKRRSDGIPYIIHNAGPYTRECDELLLWMDGIIGHYRFPKR